MIELMAINESELVEPPGDAPWSLAYYLDEAEFTGDECCDCGEPVYGAHYLCLDGGECAHLSCVNLERAS